MNNYISKPTAYREEDLKLDIYYNLRKRGIYCRTEVIAKIDGKNRRLDLVIYDKHLKPHFIIEFKAYCEVQNWQRNEYLKLGFPLIEIINKTQCKKFINNLDNGYILDKPVGDLKAEMNRKISKRFSNIEKVINKELIIWSKGITKRIRMEYGKKNKLKLY